MSGITQGYFYEMFTVAIILIFLFLWCKKQYRDAAVEDEDDHVSIIIEEPENFIPLAVAIQPPANPDEVVLAVSIDETDD